MQDNPGGSGQCHDASNWHDMTRQVEVVKAGDCEQQ